MALRVLVVDDSVTDRRMIKSIFVRDPAFSGYEVEITEASDGIAGLDSFDRTKPHLVVCDLLMPKKDGFAFCKELRASLEGRELPLMVVSGVYKDKQTELQLKQRHDAELFSKPVSPDYFARRAMDLLNAYQREHPRAAAEWLRSAEGKPKSKGKTKKKTSPPLPAKRSTRPPGLKIPFPRKPLARPRRPRKDPPAAPVQAAAPAPAPAPAPAAPAPEPVAAATTPPNPHVAPVAGELDFSRPMRGTLEQHPPSLLTVAACAAGATGTLKLNVGKVQKVVYILQGRPIFVDSNLRNETLGAYLVQRGKIDETQLGHAIKRARARKKKLGEALVLMGLLDEAGVIAALQGQARIKLARALTWSEGAYTFLPGDDFSKRVPNCQMEPVELVLSVLKRVTRSDDLKSLKPMLDQALCLTPTGERFRAEIEQVFSPEALAKATSGLSLREIPLDQELDLPGLMVQVDALRVTGLARFTAPTVAPPTAAPADPEPPVVEATSSPRPEPTIKIDAEAPEPAVPADEDDGGYDDGAYDDGGISGVLSLQDLGRPAEARPVVETSGVAELELFEPGEQVPPPHVEPEDSGVLQIPLTEDLELEEPDAVELTAAEESAAPEPEPAAPAVPPEEARKLKDLLLQTYLGIHSKSYYEVLELPDDADEAAVERAYRKKLKTFSDERYEALDLGDDDDKLIEMGLIVQQAFTVLSDPGKRQSYDETLSTAKVQPAAAPDAFGAELYFQEGQVLLKQHDLAGAESAFLRATQENPEQPDYHSYLGWTHFLRRGRGASGAAGARPHLQRAFEIAPDSVKAHEFAGWIERDARNLDVAAGHLIRALKIGPPRLDLFEAVKDLLERRKRHADLEHQYRRLIFRLRDNEPEKTIGLWVDLAYLYQRKLGQPDNARVALEVARKLSPEDPRVQAAIYAVGSEEPGASEVEAAREVTTSWQQIAEGHRQRLARAPDEPAPLHDLVALHREGGRPDQALTAAAILVDLGIATDEERALTRELTPGGLVRASSPVSATMLEQVRHPDDLPVVERLMGLLSPVLSDVFPVGADRFGSGDELRIEGSAGEALDDLLAYVQQQLGTPLPPLYWSDTLGAELAPLPAAELRLFVGTELKQPPSLPEAAFSAARALSCVGEGRRHIYGRRGAELKCAILATLTLCREGFKVPDPEGEVARFRQGIEDSAISEEALRGLVDQLLEQDKRINLSQWVRAVRCTSARIGLLVSADLGAALRALRQDEATRLDLIDFALSGLYADLRQELGVSVGG